MSKLTGYELSRQWFDFSFENPEKIKPVHTALYFFAIEHYNRLGGKEKFGLPTQMSMEAIGVKSYNTYINALKNLVEWGFISMVQKSRNQYSANIVALSKFNKALDKALDKALIKHSTKHTSEQSESTVQSIDSIDKPIKQLNNKPINNKKTKAELFIEFIKIYDLNQGVNNAKSFWMDLTDEEIEKVFQNVQDYVDSTPDKNFRAKPENYILRKIFNDEIVKKEKSSAKKEKETVFTRLENKFNEINHQNEQNN